MQVFYVDFVDCKDCGFLREAIAQPDDSVNSKLSDRSPYYVSTRFLFANALETTAQNDIEKNKLAQYKKKIDLVEETKKMKFFEIQTKNKYEFAKKMIN